MNAVRIRTRYIGPTDCILCAEDDAPDHDYSPRP